MNSNIYFCFGISICSIAILVTYYIIQFKYKKSIHRQLIKLSYSKMFSYILPILKECRNKTIHSLFISDKGITINIYQNSTLATLEFLYAEENLSIPSYKELNLLCLLIEEYLPQFKNKKLYTYHINNKVHSYYISNTYKKTLVQLENYTDYKLKLS